MVRSKTARGAHNDPLLNDPQIAAEDELSSDARPNYAAPAVEKALDIIEYLAEEAVPLTRAQLARALDRQPTELFRMLTCLENRGYLRRVPESGAYALTLKLFELSRTHSPYEELLQVASHHMRLLSDEVRESCHLSILHHEQVLVIAQEESPKPFRLSVEVGSIHPLSGTTSGRVLLANMDETLQRDLLSRDPDHKRRPAAAKQAVLEHLVRVREQGYEWTESEWFDGGIDMGVLVGSPGSQVKAALVIATLRKQGQGPVRETILQQVLKCARDIGATAGIIHEGRTP